MDKMIEQYFRDGKLRVYPSKRKNKLMVLEFLITKFEMNRDYTEQEVKDILDESHTFGDNAILRRELFENGMLGRERDGSKYWRIK